MLDFGEIRRDHADFFYHRESVRGAQRGDPAECAEKLDAAASGRRGDRLWGRCRSGGGVPGDGAAARAESGAEEEWDQGRAVNLWKGAGAGAARAGVLLQLRHYIDG